MCIAPHKRKGLTLSGKVYSIVGMNLKAQKTAQLRRAKMERLLASGKTKSDLARMFKVSRQRIHQLFPACK